MSEKFFVGKVVDLKNDSVRVLLENKNISCEKCGLCSSKQRKNDCFITLYGNYKEIKVGDCVKIFYSERKGIQMAFLIFLLPVFVFIFTVFGGVFIGANEFFSMLLGLFAICVYFMIIKKFKIKSIVLEKI